MHYLLFYALVLGSFVIVGNPSLHIMNYRYTLAELFRPLSQNLFASSRCIKVFVSVASVHVLEYLLIPFRIWRNRLHAFVGCLPKSIEYRLLRFYILQGSYTVGSKGFIPEH